LQGIPKQSTIGFLTIMEYLRYCEVGWNLKNPKAPIWILASETHLTVFFSKELSLVQSDDTNRQNAKKKFQFYDPNENGFVKTEDLESLMNSLDLLTDKEYIDIIKKNLDNENLGIITRVAFLNEFYPEEELKSIPQKFNVYHYNGLARSNKDNDVQYCEGLAQIIDFTDQPNSVQVNSIKNCLQTKWPTIEIEWKNDAVPSLN
jgi:ubiquitin carboxyl-terminal hydrolase MINDY-3/4